ncbi:flagellar basal body P-ring formation protein FlgA [Photobacterium carnosum]|uniref:flagellar basal body P-ring formation chaperone FlgA n=1 Tax=Photobacterium carnosum TaxID=2023717 RepID=UPI001C91558C|nr:flagellar basal body P-ring formation chaperone FlgA [Photobacterium carnosum]MBY3787289.1 flagellar basal body P-ring formation protein FlgA [Photobacterium carnosum]MCD9532504.1 flagellar basal body P-ring formation protein FlgA [Photobacterium carnosum]
MTTTNKEYNAVITHRYLNLICFIIGSLLLNFSINVHATQISQQSIIQQTAADHIKHSFTPSDFGSVNITAATLDSRLRFPTCSSPIVATTPGKQTLSGNVTVLVRCNSEDWQLYVPVNVQQTLPQVIATTHLGRGALLSAANIKVAMIENRFQRGVSFTDPQQIIGSKVKHTVKAGDVIQANDICLVCRNDSVLIRASQTGLAIVTTGKALSDGAIGDEIRVQNSKSKRIIDGVITAVGEVSVKY